MLMEERESIGCAVESLGGEWVSTLEDGKGNITHAIWIASGEDKQTDTISHLFSETLVKLNICLEMDIPVVSTNWLTKIGQLSPGSHWSEVDVEDHIPSVIVLFKESIEQKYSLPCRSDATESSTSNNSRRDQASSLNASISETYKTLIDENPDVMEEEAIRRAMELSLLDFAVVHRSSSAKSGQYKNPNNKSDFSLYAILKVDKGASPDAIKIAYRRRALETHPDKGGKPGEFEEVAHAYRTLLNAAKSNALGVSFSRDDSEIPLKNTAHWDTELKEHHNLVRELYQSHGQDLDDHLHRQNFALEQLGLCQKEAGSQNYNEKKDLIRNSCFYLGLAASYLSGIGALTVWDKVDEEIVDPDTALLREGDEALIKDTALQLKRLIEAAVLAAHPEWAAQGKVGEQVQAFSDFLVYTLESQTIISDWAVVVFDTSSGFVDMYKGQNYKDEEQGTADELFAASNTLMLRFTPGHYQPLLMAAPDSTRPSLKKIVSVLDECSVLYVLTDGSSPTKT